MMLLDLRSSLVFSASLLLAACTTSEPEGQNTRADVDTKTGEDLRAVAGITQGTGVTIIGLGFGREYVIDYIKGRETRSELNAAPARICSDLGRSAANITDKKSTGRFARDGDWQIRFDCVG